MCQHASSSPWCSNPGLSFLWSTCCHSAVIPAQLKGGAGSQQHLPGLPWGWGSVDGAHPEMHRNHRWLGGAWWRPAPSGLRLGRGVVHLLSPGWSLIVSQRGQSWPLSAQSTFLLGLAGKAFDWPPNTLGMLGVSLQSGPSLDTVNTL